MRNMSDISVVLDRSGSMSSCRSATIEAFNQFLSDQQTGPDRAIISMYQFDYEYLPVYEGIDIKDAPLLTDATFVPRGSTALFDAIGRTIDSVGARLSAMPEWERPSKVVVAIVTDGENNASREYSQARIAEMIRHQREKYNWVFVFMGANQNAYHTAGNMGITHGNALNFAPTSAGIKGAVSAFSSNLKSKVRGGAGGQSCRSLNLFDPADQKAADDLANQCKSGSATGTVGAAPDSLSSAVQALIQSLPDDRKKVMVPHKDRKRHAVSIK